SSAGPQPPTPSSAIPLLPSRACDRRARPSNAPAAWDPSRRPATTACASGLVRRPIAELRASRVVWVEPRGDGRRTSLHDGLLAVERQGSPSAELVAIAGATRT